MAATVKEIQEWLATLDPDDSVGIDEGGLELVAEKDGAYFEIGGIDED